MPESDAAAIDEYDGDLRAMRELSKDFNEAVDVAYFLCDRHCTDSARVALRYEDAGASRASATYRELEVASRRLATVLARLGVGKGTSVAVHLPRVPDLVVAMLATWRLGAVVLPLFRAFGPDAVSYRVHRSGAVLAVTDKDGASRFTGLDIPVLTTDGAEFAGAQHEPALQTDACVGPDDLLCLLFTSGASGIPKAVPVPVRALRSFEQYMRHGLGLGPDSQYWNMSDPGWAYGLYFGVIGPLLVGQPFLLLNAPFNPVRTLNVLREYRITHLAAAPTVYRGLMEEHLRPARAPLALRSLSSAGEHLDAKVIEWSRKVLGVPVHNQYGQTELGMAVVNHHHSALRHDLRGTSMGHAVPGLRMVVLSQYGEELPDGLVGHLAVDRSCSPLMWFTGYHGDDHTTERAVTDRYHLTGDTAERDSDGYFYFAGRSDDVIISAGYTIGPSEIEASLLTHPEVADAAVVGRPHPLKNQEIAAFVVLRDRRRESPALATELGTHVKTMLSAHLYPRTVNFVRDLPRTPSGKLQRYRLRERDAH